MLFLNNVKMRAVFAKKKKFKRYFLTLIFLDKDFPLSMLIRLFKPHNHYDQGKHVSDSLFRSQFLIYVKKRGKLFMIFGNIIF